MKTLKNLALSWKAAGRRVVHEADCKRLLARAGLSVPSQDRSKGPMAVKLASDRFPHKTEHGLVRLGVSTTDVDVVAADLAKSDPAGEIIVERMVSGAVAEWFVGCKIDATFGPIIAFGPGGIFVEFLDSASICLAPASINDIGKELAREPASRLLRGVRGRPPADLAALAESISTISRLFADLSDVIGELEVNPLFAMPEGQGVVVADALAVLRE